MTLLTSNSPRWQHASAAEDVARVDAGLKLDLSEQIALWGISKARSATGVRAMPASAAEPSGFQNTV